MRSIFYLQGLVIADTNLLFTTRVRRAINISLINIIDIRKRMAPYRNLFSFILNSPGAFLVEPRINNRALSL